MKKLTFSINTIWMAVILLSALSVHGMEEDYVQLALRAEKNDHNSYSLASLPDETLMQIFSYCISNHKYSYADYNKNILKPSLANDIKKFMQLSTMCTKFNRLLTIQTISDFCKVYDREDKLKVLKSLLDEMRQNRDDLVRLSGEICRWNGDKAKTLRHINYYKKTIRSPFYPALVIVRADPERDIHGSKLVNTLSFSFSLLEAATIIDDEKLVETLLSYEAEPWGFLLNSPIFFLAKTVEVAQKFIDYYKSSDSYSIHKTDHSKCNVLWRTLDSGYPVEVMKLYIENEISSVHRDKTNECLLHRLVCKFYEDRNDGNFLKKVTLLLNTIPKMVNTLNFSKKTPLDVAQQTCEEILKHAVSLYKKESEISEEKKLILQEFEKLTTLLREHGCLTAQEVAYNNSWQGKLYNTATGFLQ